VAVASAFFPLALAEWLARPLVGLEVPPHVAIGGSFITLSAVAVACLQRAAAALIADNDCRMPRAADIVGGGLLGACAGSIIAGTVLVAWSMLPMPWPLHVAPVGMRLDAGAVVLRAFGRCLAEGRQPRDTLLQGEPLTWKHPDHARLRRDDNAAAGDEEPPEMVLASETFIDENGNGLHDTEERYIDADGNGAFSPRLPFFDTNGNRRRDIGLIERYRLGRWDRVSVLADTSAGTLSEPADATVAPPDDEAS